MAMGHYNHNANPSTTDATATTSTSGCSADHHHHPSAHENHVLHHSVPSNASFFEVADPSMESTHKAPSLPIPKTFFKRFQAYLDTHNIKLESPCGHMWNACLELVEAGGCEERDADNQSSLKITHGWKEFACYMGIQSGDLIIFDLVSKSHFKVYIYEGEDSCEKDIYTKSMTAIEDTSNEKEIDVEGGPHHKLEGSTISLSKEMPAPNDLDCGLSTPYVISNVSPPMKKLKRDMNGDNLLTAPYIHGGMNCAFKFNKTLLTLDEFWRVWIHFHTETQEAFKDAIAFASTNPFTIMVMCHSNVCHGFKLDMPKQFANQYLSERAKEIVLLDKENKAWTITWLGSESIECSLSGGWKYFALDHDLRSGDICIFELLPMKEDITVLKVHIFKVSPSDVVAIRDTIPSKFSIVLTRVCKLSKGIELEHIVQ